MEEIETYYNYLLTNVPQFALFINQYKHLSTDELMEEFDININKRQEN